MHTYNKVSLADGVCRRSGRDNTTTTTTWIDWATWVLLHAGIDYPRELDWMEVKRLYGGAIMAVGMD